MAYQWKPLLDEDLRILEAARAWYLQQIEDAGASGDEEVGDQLALLQRTLDRCNRLSVNRFQVEALGIAFGDLLQSKHGGTWIRVEDEYHPFIALRIDRNSIIFNAKDFFLRRMGVAGVMNVNLLYDHIDDFLNETKSLEQVCRFFSNPGKPDRELWVLDEFLRYLGIAPIGTRSATREEEGKYLIDAYYGENGFQLKEVLNDYRVGGEPRRRKEELCKEVISDKAREERPLEADLDCVCHELSAQRKKKTITKGSGRRNSMSWFT